MIEYFDGDFYLKNLLLIAVSSEFRNQSQNQRKNGMIDIHQIQNHQDTRPCTSELYDDHMSRSLDLHKLPVECAYLSKT